MHHVILGAGPAGVIAAETIRKHAPNDTITMVGDEKEPPYSRMAIPYLLMGNVGERGTYLRKSLTHFDDLKVKMVHAQASSVDAAARTVTCCLPRPPRSRKCGVSRPLIPGLNRACSA